MHKVARILWVIIGTYALIAIFFQTLPSDLFWQPAISVVLGLTVLGVVQLFAPNLRTISTKLYATLDQGSASTWLIASLVCGIAIRAAWDVIYPAEFVSDADHYWDLARELAASGSYGIDDQRSFFPPGLPLFMLPAILVLGPQSWIPLVLNLLLFCGTILITYRLALLLFDRTSARVAILVLAIWPNLVLMASAPHKELLVAFLLPAAVLSYIEAGRAGPARNRKVLLLISSGIYLGFATLTQPAVMLFGVVLLGYEALAHTFGRSAVIRLGVTGLVAILTVLPWTARNFFVFGEFVPINTAGGIVFYSANNPNASGGWIPDHAYLDEAFANKGEIEAGRLGFQRGLRWIRENKVNFAKLAVIKQTRLLCCDSFGAFNLFLHPQQNPQPEPKIGKLFAIVSEVFWILLLIGIIAAGIIRNRSNYWRYPAILVLPISIFYFLIIFSVFQSEGKHHVNLSCFFAIMGAASLFPTKEQQE